jgi:hypothetical protein
MAASNKQLNSGRAQECQCRNYQQWVSGSPYRNYHSERTESTIGNNASTISKPQEWETICLMATQTVQADSHSSSGDYQRQHPTQSGWQEW